MDNPDIISVIVNLLVDSRPLGLTCKCVYAAYAATSDGKFWRGRRHSRDVPVKIVPLLSYSSTDYAAAGNIAAMVASGGPIGINQILAAVANDRADVLKYIHDMYMDADTAAYNPIVNDEIFAHAAEHDAINCYKYWESVGARYTPLYHCKINRVGAYISNRLHATPELTHSWESLSMYLYRPSFWRFEPVHLCAYVLIAARRIPPNMVAEIYRLSGPTVLRYNEEADGMINWTDICELEFIGFLIRVRCHIDLSPLAPKFAAAGYHKLARICE